MTKGTANQRSQEPGDAGVDQQGAEGSHGTTKRDTLEEKGKRNKKINKASHTYSRQGSNPTTTSIYGTSLTDGVRR